MDDLASAGCDMPFFRGHSNTSWNLLSGLGRQKPNNFKKQNIESILYYDFQSLGGSLLGKTADSWDVLFAMQHHGLPTRLLDWTTAFAPALYFALRPLLALRDFPEVTTTRIQAAVWILDPFELNKQEGHEPAVANPYSDFEGTYQENFIEQTKVLGSRACAIIPPQHTARQSAQRSVFTLHDDLFQPLEIIAPTCLRKFEISSEMIHEAIGFLTLAGVNEYSVFPDLDGLARHLKSEHVR
jgi:hypothetical protein